MKKFWNVFLCGILAAVMVVPSGGLNCYRVTDSVQRVHVVRVGGKFVKINKVFNIPSWVCTWGR